MKDFLMQVDPLWVSLGSLVIYLMVVVILFRVFGKAGLYMAMTVAIIGANLQVLKLSYFSAFGHPIALGTALFSSTYLISDLLNEFYGKQAARKGIYLSLTGLLFWGILTQLMLAYQPLSPEQAGENYAWALGVHEAMLTLFTPVPAIFAASLLAFGVSQYNDVAIYSFLKNRTGGRFLFLRNNLSTLVSTFIDNTVFSLTAFVILAADPVPLRELFFAYILGTYGLRVMYAFLDTPFIYLAKWMAPPDLREMRRTDGTGSPIDSPRV